MLGIEIARWNVDEVRTIHEDDVKTIGPLLRAAESKIEGVKKADRIELGGQTHIRYG